MIIKKQKKVLFIFYCWLSSILVLSAQSNYDIRLQLNHFDSLTQTTHYDVQLRNSSKEKWGLAGQNYRLYFDAAKAEFKEGSSKLPSSYQDFQLVQYVKNVDASALSGDIAFAKNLSFLNFAIDLSDTYNGGIFLPNDGTWLTTAQLVFSPKDPAKPACLEAVWGREDVTDTYATSFVEISQWRSANNSAAASGANYVDLKSPVAAEYIKVFLQGAYDIDAQLMHDDLRAKGYLPLIEPYSELGELRPSTLYFRSAKHGLEQVSSEVLVDRKEGSIVDWVLLELRHKDNPAKIVTTRAALVQRDGRIVDVDGESPVEFKNMPDSFYLVVRHRNHLGVMSSNLLTPETIGVDFTDPDTEVYGNHARLEENGAMLLWGGNADSNDFLAYAGGGISLTDRDYIFFDVLSNPDNLHARSNFVSRGYFNGDTNMDGEVRYQGTNTDIDDLIFYNVIRHPGNKNYQSVFLIEEQIVRAD